MLIYFISLNEIQLIWWRRRVCKTGLFDGSCLDDIWASHCRFFDMMGHFFSLLSNCAVTLWSVTGICVYVTWSLFKSRLLFFCTWEKQRVGLWSFLFYFSWSHVLYIYLYLLFCYTISYVDSFISSQYISFIFLTSLARSPRSYVRILCYMKCYYDEETSIVYIYAVFLIITRLVYLGFHFKNSSFSLTLIDRNIERWTVYPNVCTYLPPASNGAYREEK